MIDRIAAKSSAGRDFTRGAGLHARGGARLANMRSECGRCAAAVRGRRACAVNKKAHQAGIVLSGSVAAEAGARAVYKCMRYTCMRCTRA
eukprot:1965017-Prymnesium_polylepis.1